MRVMEGTHSPSPPLQRAVPGSPTQAAPFHDPFAASPRLRPQQTPQPSAPNGDDARAPRPRAQTNLRQELHQPTPLKEAVNTAFNQSPTAGQLDPALVALVTEQVIKNLQNANLTPTQTQAPPVQYPPPPPPNAPQIPQSPTQSSTTSIPARYTPPSPERDRHYLSSGSISPDSFHSDHGSSFSRESLESLKSRDRDNMGSNDTPRPRQTKPPSASQGTTGTTSPKQASVEDDPEDDLSRTQSSTSESNRARHLRRTSKDSPSNGRAASRPAPEVTPPDDAEETTLERCWQPLFDNGNPTMRLSQFLRGLALHLIDDYEPKGSLVVTPHKLLRFLEETKPEAGHEYPWPAIFGGKMTCASISVIYRKLRCQHHMVQSQNHEIPGIPALTPAGFEHFMTCLIQAHPDIQYERLAKAVMHMPISNADDKTERFPKELSRRLLPVQPNVQAEQRIISSLGEPLSQIGIQLKNQHAMPPPPPPPSSALPDTPLFSERTRQPYGGRSGSNAVDDDDLDAIPTGVSIERERKPYSTTQGSGKVYTSDHEDSEPPRQGRPMPTQSSYKQDNNKSSERQSRTNSGLPPQAHGIYNNGGSGTPMGEARNPPPRDSRSRNRLSQPPPSHHGSYSKGSGRPRSPPPSNPYTRSDPVNIGAGSFEYGSSLDPRTASGVKDNFSTSDTDPDAMRRYNRSRAQTNGVAGSMEDEGNRPGKPIPGRNPPPSQGGPGGYDSGYGSIGGPPVGSYSAAPPVGSLSNRRQSMYAGNISSGYDMNSNTMGSSNGGTDGYGSYAGPPAGGHHPSQSYGSSGRH